MVDSGLAAPRSSHGRWALYGSASELLYDFNAAASDGTLKIVAVSHDETLSAAAARKTKTPRGG